MSNKILLLWAGLLLLHVSAVSQTANGPAEINYFVQGQSSRMAAEWEPARGTMIVWPLSVPHQLAVELAKDNHLYTLVMDEAARQEARQWYARWGIDSARTTFVFAPQGIDAWWTRDWGPGAVFSPDGHMRLGNAIYLYSTPLSTLGCEDSLQFLFVDEHDAIIPTSIENDAPRWVGHGLDIEVLDLPFIATGGNVITDGLGTAFSTCVLLNENRFHGVDPDRFLHENRMLLGITQYHFLSNFEKKGIQHIDCFMKLLDEERILVAEPPGDHELYPIYEHIVQNELSRLRSVYGRPYEILRLKTDRYDEDRLAAYTNAIIVNGTIYVPLFQIPADSVALRTWRDAMPGYTVKGFTFALRDEPLVSPQLAAHYSTGYGWTDGDALHCRTRAIWDEDMLFISVRKVDKEVDHRDRSTVYATIIDYGNKGLAAGGSRIVWRISGAPDWHLAPLTAADDPAHFHYTFPALEKGTIIEYYIAAESLSGRKETRPRTAPAGTYHFRVK